MSKKWEKIKMSGFDTSRIYICHPTDKEKSMNKTQVNTANLNDIVKAIQNATNEDIRAKTMSELWELCGTRIANLMTGKSYVIDSDFSLWNCPPSERRESLIGDAFFVFHDAVMKFDVTLGIPFMAYITQMISWNLASAKRKNAKHTKREKCTDFSLECNPCNEGDSYEEFDMINTLRNIQSEDDFEEDCYRRDGITAIRQILEGFPKLQDYFNVTQEICNDGDTYCDAEAARRLGCTRANIGQLRKRLMQLLIENGLVRDCRMLMAA